MSSGDFSFRPSMNVSSYGIGSVFTPVALVIICQFYILLQKKICEQKEISASETNECLKEIALELTH